MISIPDYTGAACVGEEPLLFDVDAHHHNRLGPFNSCWMCADAKDICDYCPVKTMCLEWGIRAKSSGLIWGGMLFERGKPKRLRLARK